MIDLPKPPQYNIDGQMRVLDQKDFKIIKPKISKGAQGSVDLASFRYGIVPRGGL